MEMKLGTAYKWMAWGTFCTAIHLNFGSIQILPPYVGFAMVAFGMYGMEQEGKRMASLKNPGESVSTGWKDWILRVIMVLLVAMSLGGTVIAAVDTGGRVSGWLYMLGLSALELAGYTGGMSLMKKCGARVGIWQTVYLVVELAAITMGVAGVMTLTPLLVVLMTACLMIGRMTFFFCVWIESRNAEV